MTTNIHASLRAQEIECDTNPDWLDEVLDVQVWTKGNGAAKVELLLTCGGPTVRVEWDSRWPDVVDYYHSWGADNEGRECKALTDQWSKHIAPVIAAYVDTWAELDNGKLTL